MKKYLLLALYMMLSVEMIASKETIIPKPQVTIWDGGTKVLDLKHYYIVNDVGEMINPLLNIFLKEMKSERKIKYRSNGVPIIFKRNEHVQSTSGSYRLTISQNITIEANDYRGFLYGTRSLFQLIRSTSFDGRLSFRTINDYPSYQHRILMLDVARKFIPYEELKDYIRSMAWFKMNELHLHLSDNSWGGYPAYRLPSTKYPELTSKDGHYSWDEIRRLQDFAKIYGVVITPEIDSPGHSLAFTRVRPDLKSKLISENYLDILNSKTIPFVQSILEEVIPHFDAPDFHIGTDEYRIHRIKDPEMKLKIGEAFRDYINQMSRYVETKGKSCRIWSGYEHMPGRTLVNKNTIIDMWETSDAQNKLDQGYRFINSSHYYTYIVPGAPYYGVDDKFVFEKWTPLMFGPKKESNLKQNSEQLLGGALHVWNDFGPTGYTTSEIARLSLPSLAIFSQKLWGSPVSGSYEDFQTQRSSVMDVPLSHLLDREKEKDRTIIKRNHANLDPSKALILSKEKKEITYPWTLELEIFPKDTIKDEVAIISSRNAALYSSVKHLYKKKKTSEMKEGVTLVRANQNYFHHPLDSHRPDILVYDYQLKPEEWQTIKLIGEKNKTTLFVNGKEIGSYPIQTVCPIHMLGSDRQMGFNGSVRNLKVYNYLK
ncbi:family 20 glycosylhydrolase [Halosquirtibacter xylanolyticus]|uniref:beta-N-acetylhexosaminidase n=1 Tax=Halosquirtibacter xylanolyticus TaxID=3374599 RepID=UPI003747C944|nr:family 20 glycosylhydrolase [Prolixibacteraceae bacterium]